MKLCNFCSVTRYRGDIDFMSGYGIIRTVLETFMVKKFKTVRQAEVHRDFMTDRSFEVEDFIFICKMEYIGTKFIYVRLCNFCFGRMYR